MLVRYASTDKPIGLVMIRYSLPNAITAIFVLFAAVTTPVQGAELAVEPTHVTVTAGSIGGSYFVMNTAMFDIFSKHIEGLAYAIVPGGSVANPIAINKGDAQFGLSFTNDLKSAVIGQAPYSEPLTEIRAIANVGFEARLHVFVAAELGVQSMEELVTEKPELKVDTGPRGTGSELASKRVLELHGYSYEDIRDRGGRVIHSQFREMVDRLKDGHLNALMYNDLLGAPLFADLVSSRDVKLLSLEESVIDILAGDFGYTPGTIPAGTYEGQNSDVATIKRHTIFICHKDMAEGLVYVMTKLMFEYRDDLALAYRAFSIEEDKVAADLPLQLHPGAARYYRELGLIQ